MWKRINSARSETEAPQTGTTQRRSIRWRRGRAIIAAGAVLGIGAVGTLAAWTDAEYATGNFRSGIFNLEGSTTSATAGFAQHATAATTATIDLSNIAPSDVVYVPYWIRLTADSTDSGTLNLTNVVAANVVGSNVAQYSWEAVLIPANATCNVTDDSMQLWGLGSSLATNDVAGFTEPVSIAPGDVVQVCVEITAKPTLQQGGVTSFQMQFAATT